MSTLLFICFLNRLAPCFLFGAEVSQAVKDICLYFLAMLCQYFLFRDYLFIGSEQFKATKAAERSVTILGWHLKDAPRLRSTLNLLGSSRFILRLALFAAIVWLAMPHVLHEFGLLVLLTSIAICFSAVPILTLVPLGLSTLGMALTVLGQHAMGRFLGLILLSFGFAELLFFIWMLMRFDYGARIFADKALEAKFQSFPLGALRLFFAASIGLYFILPKPHDATKNQQSRRSPKGDFGQLARSGPRRRGEASPARTGGGVGSPSSGLNVPSSPRASAGGPPGNTSESSFQQAHTSGSGEGQAVPSQNQSVKSQDAESATDSAPGSTSGAENAAAGDPSRPDQADQGGSQSEAFPEARGSGDREEQDVAIQKSSATLRQRSFSPSLPKVKPPPMSKELLLVAFILLIAIILILLLSSSGKKKLKSKKEVEEESGKIGRQRFRQQKEHLSSELRYFKGSGSQDPEALRLWVIRLYNLLLDHLALNVQGKAVSETPDEYAQEGVFKRRRLADALNAVTVIFCSAYYGLRAPSVREWQSCLDHARRLGLEL